MTPQLTLCPCRLRTMPWPLPRYPSPVVYGLVPGSAVSSVSSPQLRQTCTLFWNILTLRTRLVRCSRLQASLQVVVTCHSIYFVVYCWDRGVHYTSVRQQPQEQVMSGVNQQIKHFSGLLQHLYHFHHVLSPLIFRVYLLCTINVRRAVWHMIY